MSNIFYGIRRLLLVNTAGYWLGEFPLDRPLSISGPNNLGKTAAINALQFPFLSNMNDMSFSKSNDDTRKYYFPYDNSYVVSEIVTEAGTYVVGAAGKGPASGWDYQLFAYQASYEIKDFLVNDSEGNKKKVRNIKELTSHLAKRGVWLRPLNPKQMRDALMGKTITLPNDEKFTIGVFRLRTMTDENYRLFIRVFKNLLHMANVNLGEIKRLLIDVLLPGGGSTTVDFMARYEILNEEVNKAQARVDTATKIVPDVNMLMKAKGVLDEAYGILRALWGPLTSSYQTETDQRKNEITVIKENIVSIEPTIKALKSSQDPLQNSISDLTIKKDRLEQRIKLIINGEGKYALYPTPEDFEKNIEALQVQLDQLIGELQQAQPEGIDGIRADIIIAERQIKDRQARMSTINNNLLFFLTEYFSEPQIIIFAKLLNTGILSSLPLGDDGVAIISKDNFLDSIRGVLSMCHEGYYDDGRVRINLEKITSVDINDYFNYDNIQEELKRLQKRKASLERNLAVALDFEKASKNKDDLARKIEDSKKELAGYRFFLQEKGQQEELEKEYGDVVSELSKCTEEIKGITDKVSGLAKDEQRLSTQIVVKEAELGSINEKYRQVVPIADSDPIGLMPSCRLPVELGAMIDTYLRALEARNTAKRDIQQCLAIIESKGGRRFVSGQDEDITIRELVEAIDGTKEYIKHTENCQRAVTQEIGALLKKMTDRFDTFTQEVRRFNRQMNARRISNIKHIAFIVDDNNEILRTVRKIVNQDSIFSNLEAVRYAVHQLDSLITEKGVKLSLENFFDIGIEVELENGQVTTSFSDTNVQSTGTGLTVKVILNVMLLNRLLFIKPGQVVNIPIYIDEAAQIDSANQQTLINQCLPAGFVPVFASVEAQSVADYWIGLREIGGRIYVDQDDWFHLSREGHPEVIALGGAVNA